MMVGNLYVPTPMRALAQGENPSQEGRWRWFYPDLDLDETGSWITYNRPARWRLNLSRFPTDQQYIDDAGIAYAPEGQAWDRNWHAVYGISAALLPRYYSDPDQDFCHGWVLLWGHGRALPAGESQRIFTREAEPAYYSEISGYLDKLQWTPVLLWRTPEDARLPANNPVPGSTHGYVRYRFDDPLNDATRLNNSPRHNWPGHNLYGSGHTHLPSGELLIVGGHATLHGTPDSEDDIGYVGLRLLTVFKDFNYNDTNVHQNMWVGIYRPTQLLDPPAPRWGPSVLMLPSPEFRGKAILVVGGVWYSTSVGERRSNTFEVYDACSVVNPDPNNWNWLSTFPLPDQAISDLGGSYPRLHLVSYYYPYNNDPASQIRAHVAYTGPGKTTWILTGTWQWYQPDGAPLRMVERIGGNSVLLANPVENPMGWKDQVLNRVLVLGGYDDEMGQVHASTEVLTFSPSTGNLPDIQIQAGPLMHTKRAYHNAVLLPTGQIVVVGGVSRQPWRYPEDTVLAAELYTWEEATLGRWDLLASPPTTDLDGDGLIEGARVGSFAALLLMDGRVLVAGTAELDQNGQRIYNYVPLIYEPPYLFRAEGTPRLPEERPRILAAGWPSQDYGQVLRLQYQPSVSGASIRSVVLMRTGSVAHGFNFEQRLVRLHFQAFRDETGYYLDATAPWSPWIAPPGYYMLFLVDEEGVPSKACRFPLNIICPLSPGTTQLTVELEGVQQVSVEQGMLLEHSPLTIEFRNPFSGVPVRTYTLPMVSPDGSGQVTLPLWSSLPAGVYELYVHPYRSWLGRRMLVHWQPDGALFIPLHNGDAVKDNQVNLADMVRVLERQSATGLSEADVNADGIVDEQDVVIVAQNMGMQGDE